MFWKWFRVIVLSAISIISVICVVLFLSGKLVPFSFDASRIRALMYLQEIAKPPVIDHSEIVTSTVIIAYPKPELTVDDKILRDLDCPVSQDGSLYCYAVQDQGQSESLGCFSIDTPPSYLGGLQPNYPLVICNDITGKYVFQSGCYLGSGISYIIERRGKYEKIDSLNKLKSVYAPIESQDEALSYAIAATGYFPLFETEILTETEYYVPRLENTHVVVSRGKYIVRLYEFISCGCRQHDTLAIDVSVSRRGNIHEVYREKVFRDAYESCID